MLILRKIGKRVDERSSGSKVAMKTQLLRLVVLSIRQFLWHPWEDRNNLEINKIKTAKEN